MSWVAVGVTVGTAAVGMYQGAQQEKAQKRRNDASAEANKYSPWTGNRSGYDYSKDGAATAGALQGAVSGFGMGQGLKTGSPQTTGGFTASTAGSMKPSMGGSGNTAMTNPGSQNYWQGMMRRSFTGE